MHMMPYSAAVLDLIQADRLPPLGPGTPDIALKAKLSALTIDSLFPSQKVTNSAAARCCLSGLWLLHNFLDESHTLSQEIDSAEGSFWHGIMHRRELDYSNAKYWFRRVGAHPIFPALAREAANFGYLTKATSWDPFAFVDKCQEYGSTGNPMEVVCQKVQLAEWKLLFGWCADQAIK